MSHRRQGDSSPSFGLAPPERANRATPIARRRTSPGGSISLSAIWPDILKKVPLEDRALAQRALMMPLVMASDQKLDELMGMHSSETIDFLIVDGVVLKQTVLMRHQALELLSSGDLLAPPLTAVRQLESRSVSSYLAHGQVSLAPINARFGQTARHWPGIADLLHDRLGQQTHRASTHAAMLHLARIDDRVVALFADLAERFGRVSTAGLTLDLPLTHEIIGGLVGSRRPTVSLSLKRLSDEGLISSHGSRWTLSPRIMSA